PARSSTPKASSSSASAPSVRHSTKVSPPISAVISPRLRLAMAASQGREGERAGGFERELEGDLARVVAAVFERRHLERSLDRAEIRHHDLPGADVVVEEQLADIGIGRLVLEDTGAADAGPAHAGAGEQFAPAARSEER